jgi:hypothetical protein
MASEERFYLLGNKVIDRDTHDWGPQDGRVIHESSKIKSAQAICVTLNTLSLLPIWSPNALTEAERLVSRLRPELSKRDSSFERSD